MKRLLFALVFVFLVSPTQAQEININSDEAFTYYFPAYYKQYEHTQDCVTHKAGVAYHGGWELTEAVHNELCFSKWYFYDVRRQDESFPGFRLEMFYCPSAIELFEENIPSNYRGWVITVNERNFPQQCQATDKEYVVGVQWLIENYPDAKLVIGNQYGHDHIYSDNDALRNDLQVLVDAGVSLDSFFALGIHDYSYGDPSVAVESARRVMADFGTTLPIVVTEFNAGQMLPSYLDYYNSQDDVLAFFYYAPCHPEEVPSLVERTVYPDGSNWPPIDCYEELTPNGQVWKQKMTGGEIGLLGPSFTEVPPYP